MQATSRDPAARPAPAHDEAVPGVGEAPPGGRRAAVTARLRRQAGTAGPRHVRPGDSAGPAAAAAGGDAAAWRRRLVGPPLTPGVRGWIAPLAVAAVAAVLRLWNLAEPRSLVFDETYYVKHGYTLLRLGYEAQWIQPSPDPTFAAGTPDIYLTTAEFVVHPPVGKAMIALGMWLTGGATDPFSWRIASAGTGILSVLLLARIARRLFRSALLGAVAGLLLAVEGHHLVHSRTGLLDGFLAFWALAAFGCLLLDRDAARARLAGAVAAAGGHVTGWGPRLGVRWWRVAAGVCLGMAAGTKWSGLYFAVAFGLATVLWDVGARRAVGVRHWALAGLLRDGVAAFAVLAPAALVTYLATWTGWFRSEEGHLRQWAAEHPATAWGVVPDALRSLWHYHAQMYSFHVNLEVVHAYQAHPWSWLVMGRPTSFYYRGLEQGEGGCAVEACSRAITSLGNPVVWWGGTGALAVVAFCWLLRRDWRAGAVLAGIAGGYLPWFLFTERTIYTFYAVAFVPYVVLALTYALGLVLGPPGAEPTRRAVGAVLAGAVLVAAVGYAAYFWPVNTAQVIPYEEWRARMWLASWI